MKGIFWSLQHCLSRSPTPSHGDSDYKKGAELHSRNVAIGEYFTIARGRDHDPIFFPIPDQKAEQITRLLVEEVIPMLVYQRLSYQIKRQTSYHS